MLISHIALAIRALTLLICVFSAGCMSLASRGMMPKERCPIVYPGVRADFSELNSCKPDILFLVGGVIDSPFSFVLDTLLLPRDLYRQKFITECSEAQEKIYVPKCDIWEGPLRKDQFEISHELASRIHTDEVRSLTGIEKFAAKTLLQEKQPVRINQLECINSSDCDLSILTHTE